MRKYWGPFHSEISNNHFPEAPFLKAKSQENHPSRALLARSHFLRVKTVIEGVKRDPLSASE